MLARFSKFLVITALVATTGFHWALLQTVAWTSMLASNLCTESVSESVAHTFDGQHPCCLCRAIAAAKKSGPKNEFTTPAFRFEYPPAPANVTLYAPTYFTLLPVTDAFAGSLVHPPLTPPPRAA